jgi:hypothetical protein
MNINININIKHLISGIIMFSGIFVTGHAQVLLTDSTWTESFDSGVHGTPAAFFGASGSTSGVWANNNSFPGWYAVVAGQERTFIRRTSGNGVSIADSTILYVYPPNNTSVAIGSIRSDANTSATAFGIRIKNTTGATLTAVEISYLLQQRQKTSVGTDGYDFQYSTNATSLTDGTWTDFDALDGNVITVSASSDDDKTYTGDLADSLDSAYAKTIVSSISGLSVANGQEIWFRWFDRDVAGNEAVLTIDDFRLVATLSNIPEPGTYAVVIALVSSLLALRLYSSGRNRNRMD